MKISLSKSKIIAFSGNYPIRTKFVMKNTIIEQVTHIQYLGCAISYEKDTDGDKINTFPRSCGTVIRTLNNKTLKDTRLKLYKVMAVCILFHGSECWAPRKRDLGQRE